uniref:Uncharacterized protein n=1 Tax=Kalanchoe fedtschenkoi TaxID=63787 RepID=A0A7N0V630_KALFE
MLGLLRRTAFSRAAAGGRAGFSTSRVYDIGQPTHESHPQVPASLP